MRFNITMNMPANSGKAVHQIICDHDSESLADFIDYINSCDFVLVEEIYLEKKGDEQIRHVPKGEIALNPLFVGKVKEYIVS